MTRQSTNGNGNPHGNAIWMRRVVPAGYERATLILDGTSPLLMNSADADRSSETYRAYALLGKKKGKSLDDEQRLAELEWSLRLYLDAEIGPYVPGINVKELLRSSATKWRKGQEIVRSLAVLDYRIPLLYEGPRDQAGLWENGFSYTTMVANAGAGSGRVPRTRPKFNHWAIAAEIAFDPEDLDFDFLTVVADRAMKYGLGDGRTIGFGAFTSSLERGELHKVASNGCALKERDKDQVLAHLALVDRLVQAA